MIYNVADVQRWQTSKAGACAGAFFLGLSTVLSIAFTKRWTTWNYYVRNSSIHS